MKKHNRFVKGVCGFLIAALLLGAGGLWINDNTLTASASLNDDLATIDSALSDTEQIETANAEAIADMEYLVSDNIVVKAFTVDNVKIPSKSYIRDTMDATYDGYTAKGTVGYYISNGSTNGANRTYCTPSRVSYSGGNVNYTIRNRASSDAVIKITVYVLYAKTK